MQVKIDHIDLRRISVRSRLKKRSGLEFLFLLIAFTANSQIKKFEYPEIKTEPGIDVYFSDTIVDPYRSLEKDTSKSILEWYSDQNALAVSVLQNIEGRAGLLKTYLEYDARATDLISLLKITPNGNYFYLKQLAGDNIARVFYRKNFESPETLLYDPTNYGKGQNSKYDINYLNPSWDGSSLVIALSTSGNEISDLVTISVKNKFEVESVLHNTWPSSFLGVSWLPDNSGFTYLYFPQGSDPTQQEEKSYSVLHRLKQNEDKLIPILGSGIDPSLNIPSSGVYPITKIIGPDDQYVIGYLATVENFWDAYYSRIEDFEKGKPIWKKLYKKSDKVYAGSEVFVDEKLYFKSAIQSSNYQIMMVDIQNLNFENPIIVMSSVEDETITDFKICNNRILATTSKNGVEAKLYLLEKDSLKPIKLPFPSGYIELYSHSGKSDNFWVTTAGWTKDYERYKYSFSSGSFVSENLSENAEFPEFQNIVAEELEISSYDGVMIPVSILHLKNMKNDSENPIFFYGYGAYGTSIEPFYSPVFLEWVRRGGILCIPHVRGGGEKGEEWHTAGLMSTKQNTWKDLIAAIKYTHQKRFSRPEKTVIYSSSAGGIMVGMAMISEPSLMSCMIAEVPQMNPSRTVFKADGGGSNELEYGSLEDSLQAKALLKMDPYLNLQQGESYPAILLTAGVNDPRIPLWIPGKFIARAQKYSSADYPILLRVDQDAGHGNNEEYQKYYEDYADVFSFALCQTKQCNFSEADSNVKSEND